MSSAKSNLRVMALYPIFMTGEAVSHITLSLCRYMDCEQITTRLISAGHAPATASIAKVSNAAPWVYRLLYTCGCDVRSFTERRYLKELRPGDVAYLWPNCSPELYQQVKARGCLLVKEMINTPQGVAKRILDDEYEREGMVVSHDVTERTVAQEQAELDLADAVFAASPIVGESLLSEGVAPGKILSSSYGWEPARIGVRPQGSIRTGRPRVLFLGRGCVRKGIHLLLRAWERVGGGATLVIAGRIDREIVERMGPILSRADVDWVGYTRNIVELMAKSDLFVFPSLEEGGPLVTYEAMGAGLPSIVSPMGAGVALRHGRDGFVIDPHDTDSWVETIRLLIQNADLRQALGASAWQRAREFTWQQVGRRRARQLLGLSARMAGAAPPREPAGYDRQAQPAHW
jgi:glycosyltransferase involved in cell wall biosynthesis